MKDIWLEEYAVYWRAKGETCWRPGNPPSGASVGAITSVAGMRPQELEEIRTSLTLEQHKVAELAAKEVLCEH